MHSRTRHHQPQSNTTMRDPRHVCTARCYPMLNFDFTVAPYILSACILHTYTTSTRFTRSCAPPKSSYLHQPHRLQHPRPRARPTASPRHAPFTICWCSRCAELAWLGSKVHGSPLQHVLTQLCAVISIATLGGDAHLTLLWPCTVKPTRCTALTWLQMSVLKLLLPCPAALQNRGYIQLSQPPFSEEHGFEPISITARPRLAEAAAAPATIVAAR